MLLQQVVVHRFELLVLLFGRLSDLNAIGLVRIGAKAGLGRWNVLYIG